MMSRIKLGNVMIDCDDEQRLCDFYHGLLGWDRSVRFGRPALSSGDGVVFLFIESSDYAPPAWPEETGQRQKQMHFDFQVPDVATAVEHAESLGARRTTSQYGGDEFVTMLDPAGHPFCLCAESNRP